MTKAIFQRLAALTLACVVACLVILPLLLAAAADSEARAREEEMLRRSLTDVLTRSEAELARQAIWDEAVQNLQVAYDADWAAANIGGYFGQSAGFDAAFVLGPDNNILYAMHNGETVRASDVASIAGAAGRVVTQIRTAQARLGVRGTRTQAQGSDVRVIGGRAWLIDGALVLPEIGGSAAPSQAPIILCARSLDGVLLHDLAQLHAMQNPLVTLADQHIDGGRAVVAITDQSGGTVANISWEPARPGAVMLARLAPAICILMLLLLFVGRRLYARFVDAAERLIDSEARASKLAFRDALTGVANRAVFAERMSAALDDLRRSARPYAVHCIDLDRFKEVNDTLGHEAGDQLLCDVAQRLVSACRPSDTIARIGGDEFAIIQHDATPEKAAALADRLIGLASAPFALDAGQVFIGCSIGIAMVQVPADDVLDGMRQADLALYRAKLEGRGRYYFFEPSMDAMLKRRQAIKSELRAAIAEDALELAYQPQVDRAGVINGVEALVRWNNRDRGALAPQEFLAIAAEAGLANALGEWILRKAFEDSRALVGVKVAINLSSQHVRSDGFCRRLSELVQETRVNPRDFELEIAEDVLDHEGAARVLKHMRELGFTVTLDDFGVGPLSFRRLKECTVDKVKIDRTFVSGLGCDAEAEAVVGAIIRLTQALGVRVVAKGVETDAQRLRLYVAGCGEAQGFLFGKPMPLGQAVVLIQRKRASSNETNQLRAHSGNRDAANA